jgi:hypothetical protein
MSINHDQAIFDAIAAATDHNDDGIFVDVQKFIDTFNSHRDRKLCTSLDLPSSAPTTHASLPSGESDPSVTSGFVGADTTGSGAGGVAAYERGFTDGVFVGREMPGVAKLSSDSEALALLIVGSDGLAMMRHEGPVQLGIRKTAMVIAALRGIAQTPAYASRIEALEAALREIDNMAPVTCEVTLAHQMADIASAALRKGMAHDDE